jgi:hypothetical protein
LLDGILNLHPILRDLKSITSERVADLLDSLLLHGAIPEHDDVGTSGGQFTISLCFLQDLVVHQAFTFGSSED